MKVRELLTDKSHWTQWAAARMENGQGGIQPDDPRAVCWCLTGALAKCYPERPDQDAIHAQINTRLGTRYVWTWNDAQERKFSEVRALVTELDI